MTRYNSLMELELFWGLERLSYMFSKPINSVYLLTVDVQQEYINVYENN